MGASDRSVRHLRLRACSEAQLRSTAIKLEDALRCATLSDAAARVLLVKRLSLGVIAPHASSQTLSRLLEQRVAAAGGVWVHGARAEATGANFVYFRDGLEARVELALQLLRGAPCSAWFWPLAVPEFKPAQSMASNLCGIARAIAVLPEAAAALPAWIAHLVAAGAAPALAQTISTHEGGALLRAAHLPASVRNRQPLPGTITQAPVAPHTQQEPLHPAFVRLPEWLQILAFAGGFSPQDYVSAAPAAAIALKTRRVPQVAQVPQVSHVPQVPQVSEPHRAAGAAGQQTSPQRSEPGHACATPAMPPGTTFQASAAATEFGGLLFTLRVLQRLDYPAWGATLPDGMAAAVARKLLALILQRLQAAADDCAWLLATPPAPAEDDQREAEAKAHAQRWLTTCRRWLRRQAHIGVASLVQRPALLDLSATHAAVHFRLSDIDIRVRRAGLDIDPGWLPWYGKVVQFHYGAASHGG